MKGTVSVLVMVVLLGAVIYNGWWANWWLVIGTWTADTWAIFFLGMLIAWVAGMICDGK